jgi:hypothetical protein
MTHTEIIFTGPTCRCVRTSATTYLVRAHDGRELGRLVWHTRWRKYSFTPAPGTCFDSTALTTIGVWMRRLSRDHPQP